MSNSKIELYFDAGFQLPKEHGFSVIFLCSVLIGIMLSFQFPIKIIGLLISILFSIIVFLSNTNIILLVKSKFRKIYVFPVFLIALFSLILLFYNSFDHNIMIFFLTGIFFCVWMILNFMNRGHTTEELIVGSMTLTLFIPLIFMNSVDIQFTDYVFIRILLLYWLVSGFTTQLILYVQYIRKQLSLDDFVFIWLCFLVSLIPFYYFTLLDVNTIVVLIEPTLFVGWYYIKKPELPDKPVFKKTGKILTFRLLLYVILLTLVTYFF